jgi:hypothetical protein
MHQHWSSDRAAQFTAGGSAAEHSCTSRFSTSGRSASLATVARGRHSAGVIIEHANASRYAILIQITMKRAASFDTSPTPWNYGLIRNVWLQRFKQPFMMR